MIENLPWIIYGSGCLFCLYFVLYYIYKEGKLVVGDIPALGIFCICSWLFPLLYLYDKVINSDTLIKLEGKVLWKRKEKKGKE